MKKLLKVIKYLAYTIVGFIVLVLLIIFIGHKVLFPVPFSEIQSIPDIKTQEFCFGVGCQPQATTVDEFIPVFVQQLVTYYKVASQLWPNNHVVNQYVLVQSIERNRAWLISPEGEVEKITKKEVKELAPIRARYSVGFSTFSNDTLDGVYLALSEKGLKNFLEYEKYHHLGTYDLFLTFSHELFHILEQDSRWAKPDRVVNAARNDRLYDVEARVMRTFLYSRLLNAVAEQSPEKKDELVLEVLALYHAYKESFIDDFEHGKYFDRIEGTAFYHELISSLYSSYPHQVYSTETLYQALSVIAQHSNPYDDVGLIHSGYTIGGWTGVLLDYYQEDNNLWKTEIMENAEITPMDILANHFEHKVLPEPEQVPQDIRENVLTAIEKQENLKVAPQIFRFLYELFF